MPKRVVSQDQWFYFWKVMEGALKGDAAKVKAYADHLKTRLEADGDIASARRLGQLLAGSSAHTAALQRSSAPGATDHRVPVDSESRVPVADEEHWDADTVPLVAGDVVRRQIDRFLRHFRAADRLAANGIPSSHSMLLYGPPGTGKTQAARYIAAELHLPLIVSRSDALISSYLGSTAKNVRNLFEHSASRPCVLFLDEFDAIAKKRDDQGEIGELKRVVIGLLQNIDAIGREHVLIAATNHEHLLDTAIWRRFAYHVHIDLPDEPQRAEMIRLFLREPNIASDAISLLSDISAGLSGAQLRDACEDAIRESVLDASQSKMAVLIDTFIVARGFDADIGTADKLRAVKTLASRRVNQSLLAELFRLSQPYVSKSLKKGQ